MLLTQESLRKSAQPDPQLVEFNANNPPPFNMPKDLVVLRASLNQYFQIALKSLGPAPEGQTEGYHEIAMRDGHKSSLKVFRPTDGRPTGPLIVLVFGGGFFSGSNDQFTSTARTLVKIFGSTVVNISYRLAPEFKFPYAQYDAIDSMKWIAANATGPILGADPSKGFLMGGTSAGAALTAPLTRLFQQEILAHPLTGQWLSLPSIMRAQHLPEKYRPYHISREENIRSPYCSPTGEIQQVCKDAVQWDDKSELRFAVLSETPLSGQPRTYFSAAGLDPQRDDALVYEEMLREAGVSTKLDFYPGFPHSIHTLRGQEILDRVKIDELVGWAWLLGKELSREDATAALDMRKQ